MEKKQDDTNDQKSETGTKESKSEKLTREEIKVLMQETFDKARQNGLSVSEIQTDLTNTLLSEMIPVKALGRSGLCTSRRGTFLAALIVVTIAIALAFSSNLSTGELVEFIRSQECLVPTNLLVNEIGRPVSDCNMCRGLEGIPIATNITKEIFLKNYAYSGRPVLVKQAMSNWSALDSFDYYFFRQLYGQFPDSAEQVDSQCTFLPYLTEFFMFEDFLKMDDEKIKRLDWYVGWSNCDDRVMKELRKHYERPFFLPDDSVSSRLDWIFIGGPGPGASIHIDTVDATSWQAQIKGEKIWTLIPPYECESVCRDMNVTVKQGDIFVVDTNVWFHKTEIVEGEMSLTIGSEYS